MVESRGIGTLYLTGIVFSLMSLFDIPATTPISRPIVKCHSQIIKAVWRFSGPIMEQKMTVQMALFDIRRWRGVCSSCFSTRDIECLCIGCYRQAGYISVAINKTIATGRSEGPRVLSKIGNTAVYQASISVETRKVVLQVLRVVPSIQCDSTDPTMSTYIRSHFQSEGLKKLESSIRLQRMCTEGKEEFLQS